MLTNLTLLGLLKQCSQVLQTPRRINTNRTFSCLAIIIILNLTILMRMRPCRHHQDCLVPRPVTGPQPMVAVPCTRTYQVTICLNIQDLFLACRAILDLITHKCYKLSDGYFPGNAIGDSGQSFQST